MRQNDIADGFEGSRTILEDGNFGIVLKKCPNYRILGNACAKVQPSVKWKSTLHSEEFLVQVITYLR